MTTLARSDARNGSVYGTRRAYSSLLGSSLMRYPDNAAFEIIENCNKRFEN